MSEILFYPLNDINPGQLLSQYSDWIYFSLILVFFISIAGITLRKHFGRPYVKPLIIAVGLMLTVGVFMAKRQLAMIFEGWGTLGLLILVFVVATIPYGLCRGFGMPGIKAFYMTYVLFYILAWFKFPAFFFSLSEHNLGLVNLGLLIVFLVSIFKMIPSSISCGEAPGYATLIFIFLDSFSGKNDDFKVNIPAVPSTTIPKMSTLAVTGYFIKCSIIFLMI